MAGGGKVRGCLWLDAAALPRGDMPRVMAVAAQGVTTAEHAAFVGRLAERREREDSAP